MNQKNPSKNIGLTWFDFHAKTKGMKYQNLSELLQTLNPKIEDFGYFTSRSTPSTLGYVTT